MTYCRLLTWLATDESIGELAPSLREKLIALCRLHDNQTTYTLNPLIGLEYHHGPDKTMDVSFKGGIEMLQLQALEANFKHQRLSNFLHQQSALGVADIDNIWVEYDHTPKGYTIAALFQRFCPSPEADTHAKELIESYLAAISGQRPLGHGSSRSLAVLCKLFGMPDYLGVLMRSNDNCVKFVCQIDDHTQGALAQLLCDYFPAIANSDGLHHENIASTINAYVSKATAKISIDINLDDDIFLPRFCLEIHPPRNSPVGHRARVDEAGCTEVIRLLEQLRIPRTLNTSLMNLMGQYPSGKKRLERLWSTNHEYLYSSYYHAKACLMPESKSLKSYIMHEYFDQEHLPLK